MERMSVAEAARRLGVSPEAIRKRIKRGTIDHDQDPGGLTYVYVEVDNPVGNPSGDAVGNPDSAALISQMQARIDSLERQIEEANERDRRKDHIIMQQAQSLAAINAPQEAQEATESPESVSEGGDGGEAWETRTEPQSMDARERVSWWRRLLGKG
jgi:DNA-binding transcriptional MerR regulator